MSLTLYINYIYKPLLVVLSWNLGKIPTIQIKNSYVFLPNEYIKSSNGDLITLTLTNIDLELFLENYNVYDLTYDSGWKFKGIKGLFTEYIDYWSNRKIEAKKER